MTFDTEKQFKPDPSRGKWSSMVDFYTANIGKLFGFETFVVVSHLVLMVEGIWIVIPVLISSCLISIPIYFFESYLGQFSSSGFISSYRIAPLFKGVGYALLVSNLGSLSFSVLISAYSLVYLFSSFRSELPWMTCHNTWNNENCTLVEDFYRNFTSAELKEIMPGSQYLQNAVQSVPNENCFTVVGVSWRLFLCSALVWMLVVACTSQTIEIIGKVLRYTCFTICGCLLVLLIRVLIFSNGIIFTASFEVPTYAYILIVLLGSVNGLFILRTGTGRNLTLASYNDFNENIKKYTLNITWLMIPVVIVIALCVGSINLHMPTMIDAPMFGHGELMELEFPFNYVPYVLSNLEVPHLWVILYFLVLFLADFCGSVTEMLSITTALFDEYEGLRKHKTAISSIVAMVLLPLSLYFITSVGALTIIITTSVIRETIIIYSFLNPIILIWVYGLNKFYSDIKFMLQAKGTVSKCQSVMFRYIFPIFSVIVVILCFLYLMFDMIFNALIDEEIIIPIVINIILYMIPLLFILFWMIYTITKSSGSINSRFKNLCKPLNWYPANEDKKKLYEDLTKEASKENELNTIPYIDSENTERNGN